MKGLLLALLLLGALPNLWAQDDFIDITGATFARLQVKVEVIERKKAGKEVAYFLDSLEDRFKEEMLWSGYFDLTQDAQELDVLLKLSSPAKGSYVAKVVSSEGKELFSKKQSIRRQKDLEAQSHKLVREIIFLLTGERGIYGSSILFVARQSGVMSIKMVNAFGKREKTLVKKRGIVVLPEWAPSGQSFLYTRLSNRGPQLMEYRFPDGDQQEIKGFSGLFSGAAWADQKTWDLILSLSQRGNTDLYFFNRRQNKVEQLTELSSSENSPSLSQDGRRLLYVSNRSGTAQIYQKDLAYKETFRMTYEGNYNVEPQWSPDGRFIAFSGLKNGQNQVFIMDREGESLRQITDNAFASEQPVWSPDSRQILYTGRKDGVQKLYLIRFDGTNNRRLTQTPDEVEEFNPSWTSKYKRND